MARVKKAYKIITFATTTAAMAMESFCLENNLPGRPHERLTDLAVVPREKPHTGAAAREQPRDSPVIET